MKTIADSVEDVIIEDHESAALEEGALNAEEEARVYKGYSGGKLTATSFLGQTKYCVHFHQPGLNAFTLSASGPW